MSDVRALRCPKPSRKVPKAGTEVMFCNFVGRAHLNGTIGTVVRHVDGSLEDTTHRCRVEVKDDSGTSTFVKALPRNLIVVTAETRWEAENRIEVTKSAPAEHLVLPTDSSAFELKVDNVCEMPQEKTPAPKLSARTCTEKGQQLLGETYAAYKKSAAGRDPGRLRHRGLGFFKDNADEEAHPCKNLIRKHRTNDTWMHSMRQGFDWRAHEFALYVDPFHIPVEQGGHAAHVGLNSAMHKDAAESEAPPLHPRIRGLLLDEDQEPEEVYPPIEDAFKVLSVFTGHDNFLPTRGVGGPARRYAEKEREFKTKEKRSIALLQQKLALSVQPCEARELPPPVKWNGRAIGLTGTWDPMAWDTQNALMDADAQESAPLDDFLQVESYRDCSWSKYMDPRPASQPVQSPPSTPASHGFDRTRRRTPASAPAPAGNHSQLANNHKVAMQTPRQHISARGTNPWAQEMLDGILTKSADEKEMDFDYGIFDEEAAFNGKDQSLPWYETGELVSSMLVMNQ